MNTDDTKPNTSANQDTNDGAKLLKEFDQKLIKELKIDQLPEDQQKQAREDLDSLINTRIINLAMIYVPEEKLQEFSDLAEKQNAEGIAKFLRTNIQNWDDKVLSELMQIRKELIEG